MTAQTELKNFPDQQAPSIPWPPLPPLLNAFVGLWLSLGFAGALVYLGLFCLGFALPKLPTGLLAVAAISAGVAILLALDQHVIEDGNEPKEITLAGLAYLLLTKRLPLLALLVFGLMGTVMVAYYVVTSLLTIEFTGESGLVIKLPGQTVYYHPIHPYGWQKTQVRLYEGEVFKVEIAGTVTPGYLQNATKVVSSSDSEQKIQWIFTGPEGYTKDFYNNNLEKGISHYEHDDSLTVKGFL